MTPNLRYISYKSEKSLHIGALDIPDSPHSVDFYAWRGEKRPEYIATHYPRLGTKRILGFTNGIVKLAHAIKQASQEGRVVHYEPLPAALKEAAKAQARGEFAPRFRPLSFEERTALRALDGLPALRLAA